MPASRDVSVPRCTQPLCECSRSIGLIPSTKAAIKISPAACQDDL